MGGFPSHFFVFLNKIKKDIDMVDRYYQEKDGYQVHVTIKDQDYSQELNSIRIMSSISTAYQVVILSFYIHPDDIILNKLFGGDLIKVSIIPMGNVRQASDELDLELLFIKSDYSLIEISKKASNQYQSQDTVPLTISTVVRKSWQIMLTTVNDIFIGATIPNIIRTLASQTGGNLKLDTNGINTDIIDQICVPPISFYKAAKGIDPDSDDPFDAFLDRYFGIYSGIAAVFCQHDGTIYIKNLTKRLNKSQTFTIYKVTQDDDLRNIEDKLYDGKHFITYAPLDNDYSGNARFASMAPKIRYIVNPHDRLSYTIEKELTNVASTSSLLYKSSNSQKINLQIDPGIKSSNRIQYVMGETGYNFSEVQFDAILGKTLSDMSSTVVHIERDLPVLNLLDIGECVKIISRSVKDVELAGKYILWGTDLDFSRDGKYWKSTARINLARTNVIV